MSKDKRQLSHSQNFLRNYKLVAKLVADSGIDSDNIIKGVSNDKQAITHESYSWLAREQSKLEKIHRTCGAKGKIRR